MKKILTIIAFAANFNAGAVTFYSLQLENKEFEERISMLNDCVRDNCVEEVMSELVVLLEKQKNLKFLLLKQNDWKNTTDFTVYTLVYDHFTRIQQELELIEKKIKHYTEMMELLINFFYRIDSCIFYTYMDKVSVISDFEIIDNEKEKDELSDEEV